MGPSDEPQVDREELCVHLGLLAEASTEDLDELLHDLLRYLYVTPPAQKG